jgi:predicted anti-sigma-YlaC factor YlaD
MTTSDLSCREFVELVTDFDERALPAAQRIRFEQHLVVCSACTSYYEQMRATVRIARSIDLDEFGPESRQALLATIEGWLARRP